MISQNMKLLTVAFALCLVAQATSKPAPAATRRLDQPPQLSDTLTVAKSPFEPVTLANQRPDARNDGRQTDRTTAVLELNEERKQTTRSVGLEEEQQQQQQKSSSTKGLDDSSGLDDTAAAGSTQSLATEKPEEPASPAETTTTADFGTEAETRPSESERDELKTTRQSSSETSADEVQPTELSTAAKPATTITITAEEPSAITTASTSPSTTSTSEPPLTTTTQEPKEQAASSTTTTAVPLTEPTEEAATTTTTQPSSSPTTTTTPEPSPSPSSPSSPDLKETTTEPTTTTTTPMIQTTTTTTTITTTSANLPETEPSSTSTSRPETEPATTHTELQREQSPATTSTTTAAPETISITSAAELESSTRPAPAETTTKLSVSSERARDPDDKASCDHLPTYNADEVQKVFREETTFRNGTIKGKFTYINFDQRYRLVHYTRLPYGPVKIDKVEELGKPKQESGANRTSAPTLNEVPNAVLQLRNLLPNSMFGFPFLAPNTGHLQPREGDDADRSSLYFYSTDSLATPNLLSPRVPVSLLAGQRVKLAHSAAIASPSADILARGYAEPAGGKLFGAPIQAEARSADKPDEWPVSGQGQAYNRFQYANPLSSQQGEPAANPFSHSYLGSRPQPAMEYQHSGFLAPAHFHSRSLFGVSNQPHHISFDSQAPLAHQAHQPHSHEHYMAQYMLNRPLALDGATLSKPSALTNENPRLRLRVKTSKSLNLNQGTKSAQLRLQSSAGHSSVPISSPVQTFRSQQQQHHQRRSGKQSHQLKPAPTNRSPVVYHVLRNPGGPVYNQFDRGYAIAYDH